MTNWKITPIPLGANFIMKEAITVGLDGIRPSKPRTRHRRNNIS